MKLKALHLGQNNPMRQHRLWTDQLGSSSAEGPGGPGGDAEQKSAVCPCNDAGQLHPGLHLDCRQQVKENNFFPTWEAGLPCTTVLGRKWQKCKF